MKKRNFIILLIVLFGIGILVFLTQKRSPYKTIPSQSQTPATAPRSLTFDFVTPFPLQPTPITFIPSFTEQPVFPQSLPEYSTSSFNFRERAKTIAQSFSFSSDPTVLNESPALLRWNNDSFILLFMEAAGLLEFEKTNVTSNAGTVSADTGEQMIKTFISEKNLLPENFSFKVVGSFPIIATETVIHKSAALSSNALLIQGILEYKGFPFIDSSYSFPAIQAVVNTSGIQKLTILIPPSLVDAGTEISLNSSGIARHIEQRDGKVVLVFSENSVQETEANISISSVLVQNLSAGFVWDKRSKIVEPAFVASGPERSGGSYVYYLIPNTSSDATK